jgi:hypothetical protein
MFPVITIRKLNGTAPEAGYVAGTLSLAGDLRRSEWKCRVALADGSASLLALPPLLLIGLVLRFIDSFLEKKS